MVKKTIKKNKANQYRKPKRQRKRLDTLRWMKGITCILGGFAFVSISSLVFLFAYVMVVTYAGFSTQMIVIGGTKTLKDEDILRTAGIQAGDNIFKINLTVTRKKLMAHPWVKQVEIERELPAKLTINITEQKAAFAMDAGGCFLVNDDGEVFRECAFSSVSVPVVRGLPAETMAIAGTTKKKMGRLTKTVLELINLPAIKSGPVSFSHIKEINADRRLGLNLFTDGDIRQIRLGFGHYEKKVERIIEISKLIKKRAGIDQIDMIDLFDMNRIVVKPAHT